MTMTLPYAGALGLEVEADGIVRMPFSERLIGRTNFLHGGAISGLLEVAALVALQHALGAERPRIKPVNVTVDFLRGGATVLTFAQGTITRLGGRAVNAEARAWQNDPARPIATARLNYLLERS
ncbi:MAG: phenylacetic acid degradation protein [Sphingomonas bacterium]|nr:phenylacetic acid degradation protein [Sphingomonas bacterium]